MMTARQRVLVLWTCLTLAPMARGAAPPAERGADAAPAATRRDGGPDAMLPIIITLTERPTREAWRNAAAIREKGARRGEVIGLLKEAAARSQRDVLDHLAELRRAGLVGERVVPLWIHNVIATDATPAAIEWLAARDDVASVRLDVRIRRDMIPVEPSPPQPPPAGGEAEEPRDGLPGRAETPDPLDRAGTPDPLDGSGTPGALPPREPVMTGGAPTCGLELVRAPEAWADFDITGRGSIVCVIDSGCCIGHPDLRNQIWINEDEIPDNDIDDDDNGFVDDVHGWNFADGGSDNVHDVDGHGTHVAGTVAGDGTSGTQTGVAPGASLMICRYWSGESFETTVWQAMQYAVDNGADAITGSIGLYHRDGPDRAGWRTVGENVIATGVVVIFAAGNAGTRYGPVDSVATPADVPDVLAVGATDCNGLWIKFSSVGPTTWEDVDPFNDWPYPPGRIKPDIAAPGNEVRSTGRCTGYSTMSGTSMATPHVAGAVALILEANPNLDHFEVREILQSTTYPDGGETPDNFTGAGLLDAYAAVELALTTGGCTRDPAWQCDGDVDGDGQVNPVDAGLVQAAFCGDGDCTDDVMCQYDLDCDGQINPVDAGIVQSLFGTCEPPRATCP